MTAHLRVWSLVLLAASSALAAPFTGPGRVGVFGSTTVVADCLARYGLPRTVLTREQIQTPGALAGFDAVVISGAALMPPTCEALDRYLEGGGHLFVDVSSVLGARQGAPLGFGGGNIVLPAGVDVAGLPGVVGNGQFGGFILDADGRAAGPPAGPQLGPLSKIVGMSRSPMRPTAGGPLTAFGEIRFPFVCAVPDVSLLTEPIVLADYATTSPPGTVPNGAYMRPRGLQEAAAEQGPAAPAVAMGKRKGGTLMLCGVPAGNISGNGQMDTDPLLLALLGALTEGRLRPQIEAEVPKLGGKQTAGNVGAVPPTDDPAPAERPDGPGARAALPADAVELERDQPEEYNLATAVPRTRGELLLNWWNAANHVRVNVSPTLVSVTRVVDGKEQPLAGRPWVGAPLAPLSIKERNDSLLLSSGTSLVEVDLGPRHRGTLAERGFETQPKVANAESVAFSDDFMRTNEHAGGWETEGAPWETAPVQNPELGANPFSYKVDATGKTATAVTGSESWDEYRFSCAVRPGSADGHLGLRWYQTGRDSYYAFRAVTRADATSAPGGFQLVRKMGGVETTLDTARGGLMAGQWYEVAVESIGPDLAVYVDGHRVLSALDALLTHGRVGLLASNCAARFDDVDVRGSTLPEATGSEISGKVPRYAGRSDVASWAGPVSMWDADTDTYGLFWQRDALWGDQALSYNPGVLPDGASASLLLDADGHNAESGLVLSMKRSGTQTTVELRRDGVSAGHGTVPAAAAHAVRLDRRDGAVQALVDGKAIATLPAGNVKPGKIGFHTTGFRPKLSGLSVWGRNLRDDAFDAAPTNWWVASGVWDLTNRWTCTPDWSWFGGMSEGEAAIWHKQPFGGDMVMEYYCGPKMMGGPANVNGQILNGAARRVGIQFDDMAIGPGVNDVMLQPPAALIEAGRDQFAAQIEIEKADEAKAVAEKQAAQPPGPQPAQAGQSTRAPRAPRPAVPPPAAGPAAPARPAGGFVGNQERCGDLNAVICGDGKSVMSGYTVLVGSMPQAEEERRAGLIRPVGACILRLGKPVATNPSFQVTGNIHNNWVNVRLERHGKTVSLTVDGKLVLSYDDPDPLPGGYAGIWTQHNGIMVPRVTISAEKLLQGWLSRPTD